MGDSSVGIPNGFADCAATKLLAKKIVGRNDLRRQQCYFHFLFLPYRESNLISGKSEANVPLLNAAPTSLYRSHSHLESLQPYECDPWLALRLDFYEEYQPALGDQIL